MNKKNTKGLIMKLLKRRGACSCQPSEMDVFWNSSGHTIASTRTTNPTPQSWAPSYPHKYVK